MTKLPNGFYSYSDGYLKSMNKQGLINYIRTIEKNWENALITNETQYNNCNKLLVEERSKAIDEFAERMKEKWIEADDLSISSEFFDFVEEIAEEMKAGGENEID